MSEHDNIYTTYQHEQEMKRYEVQCKRWFIAFLIALFMFFATAAGWIITEKLESDASSDFEYLWFVPEDEEQLVYG